MTNKAAFYPIGLNLTDKSILIVGGGTVATRKLERLLQCHCFITILSPQLCDDMNTLLTPIPDTHYKYLKQWYSFKLLEFIQPDMVFACTNDVKINRQISENAKRLGVWVNTATDGNELSDFIVPSLIEYPPLQIALFSGGASPLFLKQLRLSLEEKLGPWVGPYLDVLQALRDEIQQRESDETQRHMLYNRVLTSETLLQSVQTQSSTKSVAELTQEHRHLLVDPVSTPYP